MALSLAASVALAISTSVSDAGGEQAKPETQPPASEPSAGEIKTEAAAPAAAAGTAMKPIDRVLATEKGKLKNPYTDNPVAIAEGQKLYLSAGCNGCHGGGGGGGMCPPLTNDTWVYGADDDVVFRLIALGTDGLVKEGPYKRLRSEIVVGPMPPFGNIVKTSDDMWKIISFLRLKNPSSLAKANQPAQ